VKKLNTNSKNYKAMKNVKITNCCIIAYFELNNKTFTAVSIRLQTGIQSATSLEAQFLGTKQNNAFLFSYN
jgi:hypothetical protein